MSDVDAAENGTLSFGVSVDGKLTIGEYGSLTVNSDGTLRNENMLVDEGKLHITLNQNLGLDRSKHNIQGVVGISGDVGEDGMTEYTIISVRDPQYFTFEN